MTDTKQAVVADAVSLLAGYEADMTTYDLQPMLDIIQRGEALGMADSTVVGRLETRASFVSSLCAVNNFVDALEKLQRLHENLTWIALQNGCDIAPSSGGTRTAVSP